MVVVKISTPILSSSQLTHPLSSRKPISCSSFPKPPKGPIFRSAQQQRGLISMALPSSGMSIAELKDPIPAITTENDLLIVGPGVLGRMVAEKWRKDHPDSQIYGQTMTPDHHDELMKLEIQPILRGTKTDNQFPYVLFCAPPSRTEDYPEDIRLAASNWSGEASFLFTSSTALYDCSDNGLCDEDSPLVSLGKSVRTDVLLRAENAVKEVGGCILRLAGLYKEDRGAHTYWLEKGSVPYRPDHIVNLIHYEDAASLAVTIMKKRYHARTFLGCDNHPLSRQEIMDCVKRSGKFSKVFQGFTGTNDPLGKRMSNSKTRAEVGWEPKYASFAQFLGVSE